MHASIKELLSLRDSAPVPARVVEHTAGCTRCANELARLQELQRQLRRLPDFEPSQQAWHGIEQALQQPPQPTGRTAGARIAALLAAVGLLAALLWSVSNRHGVPAVGSADTGSPATLPQLVAQSQRIEAVLRDWPRPAVEQAATSAAIDDLQTRIQLLDTQLSSAQETGLDGVGTQQLWATRVQLLTSLLSVRYAEQAARRDWLPVTGQGDI
jgi:hypothetical protein